MKNFKGTNIEITKKWLKDLKDSYIFDIPDDINLLEKTKVIKNNILLSLRTAYMLAALSKENEIFDTSASMLSIEKEMANIKKDVVSIAVFGQMSSGKSSFLNSLVGEKLLAVSEERATATITIVRHIDNFEGQKDGNIEIHYKTKNEILFDLTNALEELNNFLPNQVIDIDTFPDNIDDIVLKKDDILESLKSLSHKDVSRKDRKLVKSYIDTIRLILSNIESQRDNLGEIVKENSLNHNDFLTSKDLSVFINNVIFYKDIELLKNIELVDTPGLGSSSQLDTIKSEEFIEKSDIVMIITDAKEPMQKESEQDILYILEDIQKDENDSNFFDKVFIIINKIDDTEKNREEIKNLLDESLDDAQIDISGKNILFVSSLYEYTKRFNKGELSNLPLKNEHNIGKEDIATVEKTIYDFSAAEATSKFLTEKIEKINKIFDDAERNFNNNLTKLDGNIDEINKRIDKFERQKEQIEKELKEELEDLIVDYYREFEALARSYVDDIIKIIANEAYFVNYAKKNKKFKNAKNDETSSYHYKTIAKKTMEEIIKKTNKLIEQKLKQEVFTKKKINLIKQELYDKTLEIQKKYENDYDVVLNLEEIKIETIKINLSKNVDFDISFWKSIKQFFNLSFWGKEDKYIDRSAESWVKYVEDTYNLSLVDEVKKKIYDAKSQIISKTHKSISEIINSIENQLQQELYDYERYQKNKEETKIRKEIVQESFKELQTEYIAKAKEQNSSLFK